LLTDSSTNGTTILTRSGPGAPAQPVQLTNGQSRNVGEWDIIRLHASVEIGRADRLPDRSPAVSRDSVMADDPTMAMRLPLH
jgi:hypothetical protein